jgi:hypothetical protein
MVFSDKLLGKRLDYIEILYGIKHRFVGVDKERVFEVGKAVKGQASEGFNLGNLGLQ